MAFDTGLADLGPVKGATWGDYDNDGLQDLYVSRLGALNLLFHNEGAVEGGGPCDWSFKEVAQEAGVSVGTVYSHFGSLSELMQSLWRRPARKLVQRLAPTARVVKVFKAVKTAVHAEQVLAALAAG